MNLTTATSRRSFLALGATALLPSQIAMTASSAPVLVELFTSQGCSSCPPADKLAAELAQEPNTFVVSLNVDYWDYLGWRDTLAKAEYSQRQYDYAKVRGDGAVYTPQMVVNGASHAVGSQRGAVSKLITSSRRQPHTANVSLSVSGKDIVVKIPPVKISGEATLWLMAIEPRVVQKIQRGENSGKDIAYINVVRNLVPAAMWNGDAYEGRWMKDAIMPDGCTSCMAVVQQDKVGPVLGLARS